jgi:magnesium-transporting ATPase (P-type)
MIEAAAIVSAVIGHWSDFAIITGLLFFNAALEFWQDRKASDALAALKKGLAPEATTMRDGKWQTLQAAMLVPGDIVKIRLGVIVPADLRLVGGDYASIDQSALTGESVPVAKGQKSDPRAASGAHNRSVGSCRRGRSSRRLHRHALWVCACLLGPEPALQPVGNGSCLTLTEFTKACRGRAAGRPRQKGSKTSKLSIHEERTVELEPPPQGARELLKSCSRTRPLR